MIRIASREALEKIVEKLSPSPKPIKLSEHSLAAGVDAALRRCDPEQEAVLRSRIIALEAEVAELNASGGVQVVLGGSYVHNSGTFLEDLDDAFGRGGV